MRVKRYFGRLSDSGFTLKQEGRFHPEVANGMGVSATLEDGQN